MSTRIAVLGALALTALASTVQAAEQQGWIWRAGMHVVRPKSDNNPTVNVDNATMLTFDGTYLFAPNWGVEVLAALPFEHDLNLNGGGKAAEVKHLPPTISLQYHFNPTGAVRPYVGAGLNYTVFFDEETRGALDGAKLKLDSSFGPAAQLGLDVDIASSWFVNADVRWIDIDTKAKLKTDAGTVDVGKVHLDPLAFGISIGRRF